MSTSKHLRRKSEEQDPAKRRATAIREMRRMACMYAEGSPGRFRIESLVQELDSVRKDPRFTSAEKDAKFRSLLNRAR